MKRTGTEWLGAGLLAGLLYFCVFAPGLRAPQAAGTREIARMHLGPVAVPAGDPPQGACAAGAPHCAQLTWVNPTTHTDGSPITGTITADVFRATVTAGVAGAYVKIAAAPVSVAAYEEDAVTAGTSANSAPSPVTLIPTGTVPNPPTGLAVVSK